MRRREIETASEEELSIAESVRGRALGEEGERVCGGEEEGTRIRWRE